MLTALDDIIERCQSHQKKAGGLQLNMLIPLSKEDGFDFPNIEEFPENQLINFEKETIGFYISKHPLEIYINEIKKFTNEDTSTLSALPNGSEVTICGIVSSVKEIYTKKNERMAFINLEDMKGFVEVVLFPDVYKTSLSILNEGDPIIVKGILDITEENVKIKGVKISSLSNYISDKNKKLHIKIPLSSISSSKINELKEAILSNQGDYKVFLHLVENNDKETVIELSDRYMVNPSEDFQKDIRERFKSLSLRFE